MKFWILWAIDAVIAIIVVYFAFVLGGERLFAKHYFPDALPDDESFFRGRHGRLEDARLSGGFKLEQNWSSKNGQEKRTGYFNCPAITAETKK